MVEASWSECVAYGKRLQNGEHWIIEQFKNVKVVDFCDFVESWGKLDQRTVEEEIQAVKDVLGIIQHLELVWLKECNLGEDHLRILHDVFRGVKNHRLVMDGNPNLGAQAWYYVSQIVLQSEVKLLFASDCDVTDECLESFMQGMDGAQLDNFDVSYVFGDSKNVQSISALLKLLPFIRNFLHLFGWEFSEDQKVELQKKLNENCLGSPLICYGKIPNNVHYLKSSPLELSPTLPEVEGLKARNTNGSVMLQWNPLPVDNVSYHIIVNLIGRAVGEPIVTDDTGCRLSSLRSQKLYHFLIWGFTNDSISKRVAGILHKTGYILESGQYLEDDPSQINRKRTGDAEVSNAKKSKLEAWYDTAVQFEPVLDTQLSERNGDPVTQQQLLMHKGNGVSTQRTRDVEDPELSAAKKSKGKKTSALDNWLATEGQFEPPLDLQAITNEVTGTTQARPNDIVVGNGNPAMQQTSELSVQSTSGIIRATQALSNDVTERNGNPTALHTNRVSIESSTSGVIRATQVPSNNISGGNGNSTILHNNGVSRPPRPVMDMQKFFLFSSASGNLYQGAASLHALVVSSAVPSNTQQSNPQLQLVSQQAHRYSTEDGPGALSDTVYPNVQQTNMEQGTSYDQPAHQQLQDYSTADNVHQQPQQIMNNEENHYQRAATQQTNASYDPSTSIHPHLQHYSTADNVHHQPQQMMDNSTDQGFQQPLMLTVNDTSTLLPEMQNFPSNTEAEGTEYTLLRTVNSSVDDNTGVQAGYGYSAGPSSVNAHQSTVGQAAPAFMEQASSMVPGMMGHHVGVCGNTQSQVYQRQEEMIKMQSEVIKMKDEVIKLKDEKITAQDREIGKLKKDNEAVLERIAALEQLIHGTSTSPQDENRSQIPFTLPMNTKEDVEENEKLLEEKRNGEKLIEFLLKVGGDGKDAVWRIMANLFSDQLAQDYSWTGRKGKNALCKLKMAKIIYRVCIEKNVDNKGCEAFAMKWLKNASDRNGGRKRRERAEKNAIENGAGGKV